MSALTTDYPVIRPGALRTSDPYAAGLVSRSSDGGHPLPPLTTLVLGSLSMSVALWSHTFGCGMLRLVSLLVRFRMVQLATGLIWLFCPPG